MGNADADLTAFAAQQQQGFEAVTTVLERKQRGHFGSPPEIARFMAAMPANLSAREIRILDPGAGVGMLSAAFCERCTGENTPLSIEIELWENDPKAIPFLRRTMQHCQRVLSALGRSLTYTIREDDFILANTARTLFEHGPQARFDLAILNPPYFKLRKDSLQSRAMPHLVHGQPNIYTLFMAVAAELLRPSGQMVAITPRSYCDGPYFRRFRKWYFDRLVVRRIHAFDSRSEAFKADAVLQENVILHAEKGGNRADIVVSRSIGRDLTEVESSRVAYEHVIDDEAADTILRVPTNLVEHEVIEVMRSLPATFRELGFEVSTGPVVSFRAARFLRSERGDDTAPLLWMHNVRPFVTRFPPLSSKPGHIEVSEPSSKLLVPARSYVLLKRFTAKEEKRRLVAGILTRDDIYAEWVGLENHLNYVYRRTADLGELEVYGLAALFNSALADRYFRAISGNTQVNATELRRMPLPDEATIRRIGAAVRDLGPSSAAAIEDIVGRALGLSRQLLARLIKVA